MSIVHVTPGLLDVRAFSIHGLSVKVGDKPIGKFGTGLKYAVATLLRNGCNIQVFIGGVEYEFVAAKDEFRGSEFQQIKMRKRNSVLKRWHYANLPFTTEYGKFWEVWMAFRELHSNTIDEDGSTFFDPVVPTRDWTKSDNTVIVVTGDVYTKAFKDRDKTFLPNSLTKREGDASVQVFNEPSNHLYWRGIRVFDLEKPSIYTYNILEDMELTEDRTLKYLWRAQTILAAFVARSKDQKLINAVVSAEPEKHFEGRMDFDYAYVSPSSEFSEVVSKKKNRGAYISPRALGYYDRYAPPPPRVSVSLRDKIMKWAYADNLPDELGEMLKYLLECKIEEPTKTETFDDGVPF